MTDADQLILEHIDLAEIYARKICGQFPYFSRYYDDLKSEGLLMLCECAHKHNGGNFRAYANKSVRGAMLNYLKKNSKNESNFDDLNTLNELKDDKPTSEKMMIDGLANDNFYNVLNDIVESLTRNEQELYDMFFVQGLRRADISKLLNVNRRSVYWKLNKLKQTLKVELIRRGIRPERLNI